VVVVEHCDRLARLGAGIVRLQLAARDREIVVADPGLMIWCGR
jgi:predicted site-specific integrase-resolvase